jgi:hypothetical protein
MIQQTRDRSDKHRTKNRRSFPSMFFRADSWSNYVSRTNPKQITQRYRMRCMQNRHNKDIKTVHTEQFRPMARNKEM